MSVQAQYSSDVVFLSRGEQERKDMDFEHVNSALLDQSTILFNNGGNRNSRKRVREGVADVATMAMSSTKQQSIFLLQPQRSSTPQLHSHKNNQTNFLSDDLAAQINQQKDEVEQFLVAQGEQLRRTLAEKRQRHLRSIVNAAEESAARRLRDKEVEAERAGRRRAELEQSLTRLRTESMAWQMKAMADQATAASLHAQLQQAETAIQAKCVVAGGGVGDECGESNRAEDAESFYVDPDRVEPNRTCRTCHCRPSTVVFLPCRHLCLCDGCDAASTTAGPVQSCPVCGSVRTGGVLVFLS